MPKMYLVTEFSTNAPSPEEFTAQLKEADCEVRQVKWHGGPRKYLVITNDNASFENGVAFVKYLSQCSWHYSVEEVMPAE